VEQAIKSFCYAGQPRTVYSEKEQDPLGNVILEMHPEIKLRAKSCKRERCVRELACIECLNQARDKRMLRALTQKAFDVDLIQLAHKAAHATPEDVHSFISDIRSKDYYVLGFAGQTLDDLVNPGTGLPLVRRIRSRFDTTPAWRKSDALKLYLKNYLTTTSLFHDGDVQMQAHTALSNALASAVQEGKTRQGELDLAARVAAGGLRTDAVIEQLVTSFLLRSKDALHRPHSSRHLTEVGAMADALATLGRRSEIDQLIRRFGVNPRAVPRLSLDHNLLPKAFGSLSSDVQLAQAYNTAARHLRAVSQRLHIMVDETVWSPAAEQCPGFLGEDTKDTAVILGGYWSRNYQDCWHYLDADQWAEQTLDQERLAKLTLHYVIARPDHRRWGFDTCTLPRKPKDSSAEEMLQLCGQYLSTVCGSGRKIRMGSLFCDSTAMLQFQLPHKVYGIADNMSDRAAISRLTPPYLGRSCLLLGQHLMALLSALLASATTASPAFSKGEHCLNAMTAFYMLCIHVACNQHKFKDEWQRHSLSVPTLRNTMGLAGHAVHASMTAVEPRFVQELGIESYFSAIKAPYQGSPSVKDGIYGAARHQLKEIKELQTLSDAALAKGEPVHEQREPLSLDAAKKCSGHACANAIQLMTWATEDGTEDSLFWILDKWFKERSQTLFRGILEYDQAEELEVEAQEITDDELEGELSKSDAQRRMELLMAVHDRAAAEEEVQKHLRDLSKQNGEADSTQDVPEARTIQTQLPEADMEPDYDAKQPRTLQAVLRMTIKRAGTSGVLQCGESCAAEGPRAVLQRVHLLLPAMRQFIRYVRLEEQILSQGVIEKGLPGGNKWNEREHLLALARRNASLVKSRLTRLEMWSQAQTTLAKTVQEKSGYSQSDGLLPAAQYKPGVCESDAQILAVRIDDEVQVVMTLCVFRGSIVRNPKTQTERMKTSKPSPIALPAACTKLLHLLVLQYLPDQDEYIGSCASPVVFVSPLNTVLGELATAAVQPSTLRLHIKLTPGSSRALKVLQETPAAELGFIRDVPDQPGAAPAVQSSATVSYNEFSFSRSNLPSAVPEFFQRLKRQYEAMDIHLVNANGVIVKPGPSQQWTLVINQGGMMVHLELIVLGSLVGGDA
ncbi:FEN1, partial [Symbiodinium sp. CCMP2456]